MLKLGEGGKAKVFAGLKVRIDRPKGFVQQGKDAQGRPWKRVYKVDYGYLPGTEGGDGEGLDVFFGPSEQAETAYLVRQSKDDGSFDEFKLMVGFGSKAEALACYDDHIPSKLRGAVREIPLDVLRMLTGQVPAAAKVAQSFAASVRETKVSRLLGRLENGTGIRGRWPTISPSSTQPPNTIPSSARPRSCRC